MKMSILIENIIKEQHYASSTLSKLEKGIIDDIGGYKNIDRWGIAHISTYSLVSMYSNDLNDMSIDSDKYKGGIKMDTHRDKKVIILLRKDGKYDVSIAIGSGYKTQPSLNASGVISNINKFFG